MTESATESPRNDYSAEILQSAIERLKVRGDARRFSCMALPAPQFNDLCARLMDRATPVRTTAEWLCGQLPDAPTRSSVERFSEVLREEYRLAEFDRQQGECQRFAESFAKGDPDALQMTANGRLSQLIAGELLRAQNGESIDTKRLTALIFGVRSVAKTSLDKRTTDARVKAVAAMIERRDVEIELLKQRLQQVPEKLKALEKKLLQADQMRSQGKNTAQIYSMIREELIRTARDVGSPLPAQAEKPTETAAAESGGENRVVEKVREILGIR